MTKKNEIVGECLLTNSGDPVSRYSEDKCPFSEIKVEPLEIRRDGEEHVLRRRASAHVFVDLSTAAPVETQWKEDKYAHEGKDPPFILPISHNTSNFTRDFVRVPLEALQDH